jgi:conjugal transfer pilus assembly protein TraE
MDITFLQKTLASLQESRNRYLLLTYGLLFMNLLLLFFCLSLAFRERTIVVPANLEHPFWISSQAVSAPYLNEMSRYFAMLRLNVTPETATNQQEALLQFTDPSFYGAFKNTLVAERDTLVAHHIALAFYPVAVTPDAQHLSAKVTGDLVTFLGETPLPAKRVSYRLSFRLSDSRLMIAEFKELAHGA